MPTQVIMPQLGESVVEGTVTKWLKSEGQSVQEFEPLLEINTDKVDTEIPSPAAGVLLKVLVPDGQTVRAGAVLAVIGQPGDPLPEIAASPDIPTPVNNGGYDWDSWGFSLPGGMAQGPYNFFDILTKHEEMDALQRPYIRNFHFYTDNRGLGYFFVNGDFKLTFDDCLRQQLSGTPDCFPGDVVGLTDITVIGDYPYFRKHPAVESNLSHWPGC